MTWRSNRWSTTLPSWRRPFPWWSSRHGDSSATNGTIRSSLRRKRRRWRPRKSNGEFSTIWMEILSRDPRSSTGRRITSRSKKSRFKRRFLKVKKKMILSQWGQMLRFSSYRRYQGLKKHMREIPALTSINKSTYTGHSLIARRMNKKRSRSHPTRLRNNQSGWLSARAPTKYNLASVSNP